MVESWIKSCRSVLSIIERLILKVISLSRIVLLKAEWGPSTLHTIWCKNTENTGLVKVYSNTWVNEVYKAYKRDPIIIKLLTLHVMSGITCSLLWLIWLEAAFSDLDSRIGARAVDGKLQALLCIKWLYTLYTLSKFLCVCILHNIQYVTSM